MIEKRAKIEVDCDFSLVNLEVAIRQFYKEFKVFPNWFNINVCVEIIFPVMDVKRLLDNPDFKICFSDRKLFFSVDRNMKPDEWSVSSFEDDTKYIIWSPGA